MWYAQYNKIQLSHPDFSPGLQCLHVHVHLFCSFTPLHMQKSYRSEGVTTWTGSKTQQTWWKSKKPSLSTSYLHVFRLPHFWGTWCKSDLIAVMMWLLPLPDITRPDTYGSGVWTMRVGIFLVLKESIASLCRWWSGGVKTIKLKSTSDYFCHR